MQATREAITSRLRGFLDVVLVVLGLFLIAVGLLSITPMGSLYSLLGLLAGLSFIMIGLMRHYEWFPDNIRSKDGFGTVLMFVSPFLIISAFALFFFAEYDWSQSRLVPVEIGHGRILPGVFTVEVPLVRTQIPLAAILVLAGIVVFAVGSLLKLLD